MLRRCQDETAFNQMFQLTSVTFTAETETDRVKCITGSQAVWMEPSHRIYSLVAESELLR